MQIICDMGRLKIAILPTDLLIAFETRRFLWYFKQCNIIKTNEVNIHGKKSR